MAGKIIIYTFLFQNTTIATVTTAEVSSAETTESPRQQPRAVTMATESSTVSYSTVHVQPSPSLSLLLTKSASEVSLKEDIIHNI